MPLDKEVQIWEYKMRYLKSYIVFIVATLAIMFCLGFLLGILGAFFASSPQAFQASLQAGSIQLIIQIISIIVGFYCFRYSVQKFIE
ncbi:MAG: hypothetical protein CMM02_05295 [Rhodopirellula sp.]|jgi:hypothetical protein|nr:hypothetical protein [Rhodopirellula sp.]|tara:strand:- start:5600 stop:5860 length:261 start_codon:yes stop_codon:yes gene_type:complete